MKQTYLLASTMLICLPSSLALAQTSPDVAAQDGQADPAATSQRDDKLEDIVVTAQRRREALQNVPIAVSAFSSEQLARQGITNTLELGNFVPNLVALNNTGLGSANAYYLRGLGNSETIATFDPPVGTYVDDIYLSRQNANNFSLLDVERVEVLRGPQGTLFGRNTTGGAINVIMREPGTRLGGYAEIGYGRFNKKLARGSVDLPLANNLAIKLSGYWQKDDGYVKNVTTGDRLNDDDGWGARIAIKATPVAGVRWNASYAHLVDNGENILNYRCNPANPSDCDGRFATTGLREGNSAAVSPYLPNVISGRKANYLLGNRTASDILTSNLAFDVSPDLTLNVITGYVHQTQQYGIDFADGRGLPSLATPVPAVQGFPQGGFTLLNDGRFNQFSQEVKLGGTIANGLIDFVAGGYYIKENNKTDFADIFSLAADFSLLLADRTLRNTTEAAAAYGQADLNITSQIKLTAGLRYTDETKRFTLRDNRAFCQVSAIPADCLDSANLVAANGVAIPDRQTARLLTPRFAVNYRPDDRILLFASATRGFKSGGWNARSGSAPAVLPFDPEKVWTYEAGFKSDLLDRRLRFNLTAFYMDVTDLQTPAALVAPGGGITFITRNFANLRNKGIEFEISAVPVRGLNLYVNGGYSDAKYRLPGNAPLLDKYGIESVAGQIADCNAELAAGIVPTTTGACGAGIVTAQGTLAKPVRTPKLTLAIGGSYEIALRGGSMSLVPAVNASYQSRQEIDLAGFSAYTGSITGTNGTFPANPYSGNFIYGSTSRPTWFVNGGLTLNLPNNIAQVSINCTNCFDASRIYSDLAGTNYFNPPMTWIAKVKYNF